MAQRLPVLYNKKPCYDIVFQKSFDGLWEELEELGAAVENGFAKAMWCGERACEDEIKEKFNASSRNMPFDQEKEWFGDTCVCCGKKAKKVMYFAKAY